MSFCINSKMFIIERYSPGDRKVLIQHAPVTEAVLLMFPELFFTSSLKYLWSGLSFWPGYTISLPVSLRGVSRFVRYRRYLLKLSRVDFCKMSKVCKNGFPCSSEGLYWLPQRIIQNIKILTPKVNDIDHCECSVLVLVFYVFTGKNIQCDLHGWIPMDAQADLDLWKF